MIAAQLPSNPLVALVVGVVLFALGRFIIERLGAPADSKKWLVKLLTVSLVLHLLCAPAQVFVVEHIYHGIADWTRYTHQGAQVAQNYRHFNFSTAGTSVGKIVNDGSVSIATGIVMTIVGANLVATFLVFAWLSFIASILFYRAFTITFGGEGFKRYAVVIFLLPSLLFWTADASKESLMFFALGIVAYGTARVFARVPGGYLVMAPGVALGALVRPNELLLLFGGFAVGMVSRLVAGTANVGVVRRTIGVVMGAALTALSLVLTEHYLVKSGGSLSGTLTATHAGNSAAGASGGVPYSTDPITYPRDLYEVLFNPLPFHFHGSSELIAAAENTVLIVLILKSLRQLRMAIRASFAKPYLMMSMIYSIGFVYAFAALGNLGLIERERTLMLPFFLVILCIPRGAKGAPPRYEWELRYRDRKRNAAMLKALAARGIKMPAGSVVNRESLLANQLTGLSSPEA